MYSSLALLTLFQTYQVECDLATDGQEAILSVTEKFFAFGTTYSLIAMDYHMPIMNGHDSSMIITNFLKEYLPAEVTRPFICLLTAHHEKSNAVNLEEYGINLKILKPIFKQGVQQLLTKAGLIRDSENEDDEE